MLTMRPSLISTREWKTIPWSSDPSTKSMFDHILDRMADIPKISAAYVEIEEQLQLGHLSQAQAEERQTEVLMCVGDLVDRLRHWQEQWADAYPGGQPYEVPIPSPAERYQQRIQGPFFGNSSSQLPPFPCRAHVDGHAGTNIYYPDVTLAQCLTLYHTSMLILKRLGGPNCPVISDTEADEHACMICRGAQWYFLSTWCTGLRAWALLPLRQAWDWFPDGGPERAWLQDVFRWIESITTAVSQYMAGDRESAGT